MMEDEHHKALKELNFTSATGTGKTKMMAKLINKFPNDYFIVTTQSRGQLNKQIRNALYEDCPHKNFVVYGLMDYRINSQLTGEAIIDKIPDNTRCLWLRDEGHIVTNNYEKLLAEKCHKIINFSATNKHDDIRCNFAHTMMLRTVNQQTGTPEDAINMLMQIKKIHSMVDNYNPCAIFRCVKSDPEIYRRIITACKKHNLKYIDLSNEVEYNMPALCEDDNEYDVIINKMKIVEGIDIRRAHVLYMDNQPNNDATTIQVIGRCRRNALLYRNDIDILAPENKELLAQTRECYVFYNVKEMKIATDSSGDLYTTFCPYISCQSLKFGVSVNVVNGKMANGLQIVELEGETGEFSIIKDEETGFNMVNPITNFYKTDIKKPDEYIYFEKYEPGRQGYKKISIEKFLQLPQNTESDYIHIGSYTLKNVQVEKVSKVCKNELKKIIENLYSNKVLEKYLSTYVVENILKNKRIKILTPSNFDVYFTMYNDVIELLRENATGFSDAPEYIQLLCIEKYNKEKSYEQSLPNNNYQINIKYIFRNIARFITSVKKTIEKVSPKNDEEKYKIAELRFEGLLNPIYSSIEEVLEKDNFPNLQCNTQYNQKIRIKKEDIDRYFYNVLRYLKYPQFYYIGQLDELVCYVKDKINNTCKKAKNNIVDAVEFDYSNLCEKVTPEEQEKLKNNILKTRYSVSQRDIASWKRDHITVTNDQESAIIGTDLFKPIKIKELQGMQWVEANAVTSKVGNYNKLTSFIQDKYAEELQAVTPMLFSGKNDYRLNTKCNSMLGYCVEYYSKYLVYGEEYIRSYIVEYAANEMKCAGINMDILHHVIVVRACMNKYRENMKACYGENIGRVIPSASVTTLIKPDFQYFVKLVVELGMRTANYVKTALYPDVANPTEDIDPNLSIRHIAGLADYITKDTILDVKVTNCIDVKYIKQVLAYHYLSTKRDDVLIKRVIVYDATSDRAVVVPISEKNQHSIPKE